MVGRQWRSSEISVNQDAGGIDDLTIGWTGCSLEISEDVMLEGLTCGGEVTRLDGALGNEAAEAVDRRPTRFHHRRPTETLDGLEQRSELEQAVDGRDGAILSLHGVHCIPMCGDSHPICE